MGATRQDRSGVFAGHINAGRIYRAAVLDKSFHFSAKGLTFVSDTYLAEWTEVGAQMRLPQSGAWPDQTTKIDCQGVVVQCRRREDGSGFEVTLLFLDPPARAGAEPGATWPEVKPLSIGISN